MGSAVEALGYLGNAFAVPALIEALTDEQSRVYHFALGALCRIGTPVVPALIEAVKDVDKGTRFGAAIVLENIGDSDTLPRKILAESRLSTQERINVLERLRRVRCNIHYHVHNVTLRYTFPETRALCQMVLNEKDTKAREGAQAALNWLNGDHDLLRPMQRDTTTEVQTLLRPLQSGSPETLPETLLRVGDEPEKDVKPAPIRPTFWQRLFGKRKRAAS